MPRFLRAALLVLWSLLASSALAQTTVTLQDGVNGYAGTTDTHSFDAIPNGNFGDRTDWVIGLTPTSYMPLMRFAIFASEGGPVPNGATISSATLTLNKTSGGNQVVQVRRLLRSWNELQADWINAATGAPWQVAGARGANDIAATAEGQGTIGIAAGAYDIDVTASVQAFAAGAPNFGWRFEQVSGPNDNKVYVAHENASVTQRPKLTITYTAGSATVTLQEGLNGYAGTTDTRIASATPTTNEGGAATYDIIDQSSTALLARFAIFQSEGGPVPNGATITSATLSFYKFAGASGVFRAYRSLKNWNESQATWNVAATGTNWSQPGALNFGVDFNAAFDGQGGVGDAVTDGCTTTGPFPDACWLNINVTVGVQAFASGTPNFGWKIVQPDCCSSNLTSHKQFNSSENTSWPTLRPKLTITYTTGPAAFLMQGQNGYTGVTDAWITGGTAADTNKGADGVLSIRSDATDSGLIRFPIFQSEGGPVPNGANITSAKLSFYFFAGPDVVMNANRVLKNWNEAQVTWNNAATGLAWTTPGALGIGTDIVATADGQGSSPAAVANNCNNSGAEACWLQIDVTPGVQAFSSGTPNFGWKISQVSSSIPGNYKNFNSRDNINVPPYRPKLVVTWSGSALGAALTATPSSGTAPLVVSFDASASNAGSFPITSLRLQFGDATEVTWSDKSVQQSHTYTSAGTYTATLTVTDSSGATSTATRTITATQPNGPTAQLVATPVSGTLSASFDASGSTAGAAPITGLRLAFGDATPDATWTDKNQLQSHTYAAAATYNATLTVTDANGLSSSKTVPVTVTGGQTEFQSPLPAVPSGSGETRATFHSMSLYWNPAGFSDANPPPGNRIFVRYRKATEDPNAAGFAWKQGWPLWYDVRNATAGWGTLPYTFRGRGSVVYLVPGTKYVFELGTGSAYETATFTNHLVGTTQSETFTETAPTTIPSGSGPFVITQGGDPATKTYKVYDGWNGASKNVIDRAGANATNPNGDFLSNPALTQDASFAIVVKASFVIVRRVVVKGAALSNIYIHPNVTDVVIEDCDISDWAWRPNANQPPAAANGTVWGATVGRNEAGGVHLSLNNSRIVVQRNKIFDPHFGNNPWDFGHPIGPVGIEIQTAGQQNVFRYNELYSTIADQKHWFLDAIAGGENFSDRGAPGSDSDVYHNNIRNVMDDGIEAEGGGLNVRVWGNYIDHGISGVATTIVHFGPTYVFRNVVNRLRTFHTSGRADNPRTPNGIADPDDDFFDRGSTFKAYGAARDCDTCLFWGGGRRYFFHNTQLQQPRDTYNPMQHWGDLGAGGGIVAAGNGQGMRESVSRNNILDMFRPGNEPVFGGLSEPISLGAGGTATNDFNFDLWNGTLQANTPPFEVNGASGRPTYKSGHGWMAFPRFASAPNEPPETIFGTGLGVGIGNFQLNTAGSLGLNAGQPLPNFTFDIDNLPFARKSGVEVSGNPDMGAHDSASAETMKFGVSAGQ